MKERIFVAIGFTLAINFLLACPNGGANPGEKDDASTFGKREGWQFVSPTDPLVPASAATLDTYPAIGSTQTLTVTGAGQYTFENGLSITVSADDLAHSVAVSVTQKDTSRLTDVDPARFQLYKIEVSSPFVNSVSVNFPIMGTELDLADRIDNISVFRIDDDFQAIPITSINRASSPQQITIQTKQFSYWLVALPEVFDRGSEGDEEDPGFTEITKNLGGLVDWKIRVAEGALTTIDVPYFDQGDSGACWSATFAMFIAAYSPQAPGHRIWDMMRFFGAGAEDGLSFTWNYFSDSVRSYLSNATNAEVEQSLWSGLNARGMFEYILEKLAEGKPSILVLDNHAVVVVGFNGDKLIVHDPNKQRAYSVWDFGPMLEAYGATLFSNLRAYFVYTAKIPAPGVSSDELSQERRVGLNITHNRPVEVNQLKETGLIFKKPSRPFFAERALAFQWTKGGFVIADENGIEHPITTDDSIYMEVELSNTWYDRSQDVVVGYQIVDANAGSVLAVDTLQVSLAPRQYMGFLRLAWNYKAPPLGEIEPGEHSLDFFVESTDGRLLEWISLPLTIEPGEELLDDEQEEEGNGEVNEEQQCRSYYTARTYQIQVGQVNETCDFDELTKSLVCSYFLQGNLFSTVRTFDSVEDFVSEVDGRVTAIREVRSGGETEPTTTTYLYDANKKLLSQTAQSGGFLSGVTYSSWDDKKRPTNGILNYGSLCTGMELSLSYDDVNRTITYEQTGGSGDACTSVAQRSVAVSDAQGNLVSVTIFQGETSYSITYTINESEEVCP